MVSKLFKAIKKLIKLIGVLLLIYLFLYIIGIGQAIDKLLLSLLNMLLRIFEIIINLRIEHIIVLVFFIYLIRLIFILWKKKQLFKKTKKYVKNKLPLTVCITGFIRTGKDRTGVALSNFLEEMKRKEIKDKLNLLETILHNIPKKVIKQISVKLRKINDNDMPISSIKKIINEVLILNNIRIDLDKVILKSNHIILNPEPYTIFQALVYYAYLEFIETRKSFISSNMPIKNMRGEFSYLLADNMLDLFKAYNKALYDHSVFYSTERNQLKPADRHQEIKKEDQGFNLHLRVFGHTFRETSHFIAIVQNPKELVTVERKIFQSVNQIMSSDVVLNFKLERKILIFIIWLLERKILSFLSRILPIRKIKFKIRKLERMLYNTGMLRSEILVMQTVETLERDFEQATGRNIIEKIVLYFPVNYTHFKYNTHAFKLLLDIPKKISMKNKLSDLKQFNSMNITFDELVEMDFRELEEFAHMIGVSKEEYYKELKKRQEEKQNKRAKKNKYFAKKQTATENQA